MADLLGRSALEVIIAIGVLDDFARRIRLTMEEVGK
jgi:hypothetical protein